METDTAIFFKMACNSPRQVDDAGSGYAAPSSAVDPKEIKLLKVYSAQHPIEAHLLKGILGSYGIPSEVRGEFLFGGRGELPVTPETAPSVWIVDDSQFDEARAIIKEYEESNAQDVPAGETWICKSCGEDSEGQFTECWNCGKPREN